MDSALGYVSIYEMAFILLIAFLVIGPRRIIRGVKVIRDWVKNGFRRANRSKAAKTGRGVARGINNVIGYYRDLNKEKGKEKDKDSA